MFFAGGPTESGTMRDVRVLRGGRVVAHLDVYDYLRTGRRDGDIRLENDDTVFIPPTGPRVTVTGEVREPGIYELEAGEPLSRLVETAGGFTEKAFPGRIQVERILDPEAGAELPADREVLDFAAGGNGWNDPLEDGDVVTVFEVDDRLRNFVSVKGEVRRPGTYELREGARLSDLLRLAGGVLETAFLDRAELVRTYEDERREQISVDLARVRSGEEAYDLRLSPRDELTVHSIWRLRDKYTVKIYGAIRNPGTYELREHMTLRDLLLQAGGLQESAYDKEVEISRVRPEDGAGVGTAEIFRVPLGKDYFTGDREEFRLEAWDNVFVREIPNYELQRNVRVGGEVEFPGVYTLRGPQETLADVIDRAGGLKETAYPEGFALWRPKDGVGRVALDLRHALEDRRSNDNVILFDGDSLFVPEEPKTVTVRGEVGYPTSLVYERGWSVGDYVSRAGGPTQMADRGQTRVIYTTGAAARVKRYWFDPEVRPGSTIVVPRKEESEGVDWGDVIKNSTSVLASLATVVLVVDRVGQ
jgi:protein involved in polysaccharide export with SLBB domain